MESLYSLPPQPGCGKNVGLVDQCYPATPSRRIGKSYLGHPLYLGPGVHACVECLVTSLVPAPRLPEVHAASEFPQHYEVGSADNVVLQRRGRKQGRIRFHRPYVGEQAQSLAHPQQTLLRAHFRSGVIVILRVSYGSEKHGVGSHAHLVRSCRIRVAGPVYCRRPYIGIPVYESVGIPGGDRVKHLHGLPYYLRADSTLR